MSQLRAYERRVHSQYGEDGIIAEILRRTGVQGLCVEVGCAGRYGNCYLLAEQGRPTLFVDVRPRAVCNLMKRIHGPHVSYKLTRVTAENVNQVVPPDVALLSIDIDGPDYWVWKALEHRPAVVVIEYNWVHPPPARRVVPYAPDFRWDGTAYYGASLAAMAALGRAKGYLLAGTDSAQLNAYVVRRDVGAGVFDDEPEDRFWGRPPWGGHGPLDGRSWQEV